MEDLNLPWQEQLTGKLRQSLVQESCRAVARGAAIDDSHAKALPWGKTWVFGGLRNDAVGEGPSSI